MEYKGTTAGWKNSFAYEKLIQLLIQQIISPDQAIVLGGTWRIPVMEGLLNKSFVRDLQNDGTYNDASFAREYESEWCGDAENAYFSAAKFDAQRTILQPEFEYSARSSKSAYYILGVDVGRLNDQTEICPIKTTPQVQGDSIKSVVNFHSLGNMDFEQQAIEIKKLAMAYQARRIAIDANGIGVGLVDIMVKSQVDPKTGEILPPFGVYNDEDRRYVQYKTPDMIPDMLYLIKANAPINTEAHAYVQSQLSSGKIRFLIDENQAKVKLMSMKMGQAMSADKRAEYLRPFTLTTVLREQMLNLIEESEGVNIILKRSTKKIKKDKFSALEYGLYYIKQEESRRKKKRSHNVSDFTFFTTT